MLQKKTIPTLMRNI